MLIIYLRGYGVNLERFQLIIFYLEIFSRFLSFNHFLTSSYIVTQYLQKLVLIVYETSWMYRAYTKRYVVKVLDIFNYFLSIDRYFPLLSINFAVVHNSRINITKYYEYIPIKYRECAYDRISKRCCGIRR